MNPINLHIPGVFQTAGWYIYRLLKDIAVTADPHAELRIAGELDPSAIHVNQSAPQSPAFFVIREKVEALNHELLEKGPRKWLEQFDATDQQTADAFDPSIRNDKMAEAKLELITRWK